MESIQTFLATLCLLCLTCCAPAHAAVNTANVLTLNTASTNVTTGAYVTLSSAIPFSPGQLIVVNGTTSVIKIAYGASGSETDFVALVGSGQVMITLNRHLASGTRLAVEAVSGTASSGYIAVSLLP